MCIDIPNIIIQMTTLFLGGFVLGGAFYIGWRYTKNL